MSQEPTATAAVERSAIRKMSWGLLPMIGLGYGIAYMDRANIGFAALQMNADLGFSATVYGLGAGLFFLSYALFEIPSNIILSRMGARLWIARIMFTWGVLATCMMFVTQPWQFYVMRFLLGLAEAGFFPGVVYYLGQWFPSAHLGRAISRFYVAWPLSLVAMGAVSGWLLGLDGLHGLQGWQWLFLVQGSPAIILSVFVLWLLPDSIAKARFLTPEEKAWAQKAMAEDRAHHAHDPKPRILRELARPAVWGFALVTFVTLGPFYAFTLSAPEVIKATIGLDAKQIGYLTMASGAIAAIVMLLNSWSSDRTNERFLHVALPMLVVAGAYAGMRWVDSPPLFMACYAMTLIGQAAYAAVVWVAPSKAVPPHASAVAIAVITSVGQLGSFIAPFLWGLAKDATGDFRFGLSLIPFGFVAGALGVMALGAHLRRLFPNPRAPAELN